jgi:hypothetical protein
MVFRHFAHGLNVEIEVLLHKFLYICMFFLPDKVNMKGLLLFFVFLLVNTNWNQ